MRFPEFTEEWKKYDLSDCSFFRSERINTSELDVENYISTENMLQNFQGISIANSIPDNINVTSFKEGDILISNIRPYLKKVWQADRNGGCSADVFVLKANNTICSDCFLHYLIANDTFINFVMSGAKGIKMPRGDKKQMVTYNMGIPHIKEQNKISCLLDLLNKRIVTQNKIIEDLKKLKSAICNHYFKVGKTKLGDIGTFVRGLTYSSSDVVEDSSSTVVLRSNNIINGEPANLEDLVLVSKNPSDEQILKEGDIIICMANGSSSLVGKVSYFNVSSVKVATVGAFCGIYRSNNPIVKWLLQSGHYRKSLHKALQGGNGAIANVYPEDILNISFEIPQNDKLVVNTLSSIENKMITEQKVLNYLQLLKQYLLSQMFI